MPHDSTPTHTPRAGALHGAPGPHRVLIADDDPTVRRVLTRWFGGRGWHVCEAADGVAVIELLAAGERFDLVLCDQRMPRSGGAEVFRWVAAEQPSLVSRVVIMSGDVHTVVVDASPDVGRCRLLAKPFDLAELADVVHELVPRARAA